MTLRAAMATTMLVLIELLAGSGVLCSGFATSTHDKAHHDSSSLTRGATVAGIAADFCAPLRTRESVVLSQSRNLTGVWVSPRCEMVRGPQFVLRKYEFHGGGGEAAERSYRALKFYYSDETCSEPAYALYTSGRLHLDGASWVVDEAYETSYAVDHALVMAYTREAAKVVVGLVSPRCRRRLLAASGGSGSQPPLPYKALPLLRRLSAGSAVAAEGDSEWNDDGNCVDGGSLDVSMSELSIVRQMSYVQPEMNYAPPEAGPTASATALVDRELQLGRGDDDDSRRRPSALQPPLKAAASSAVCATCACVLTSTMSKPPRGCGDGGTRSVVSAVAAASAPPPRRQPPAQPLDVRALAGDWYSSACESHSGGLFALRWLSFVAQRQRFLMEMRYFSDAYCTAAQFAVAAAGTFAAAAAHPTLRDAAVLEFAYDRVTATSQSVAMTETLNAGSEDGCATSGPWRLNVEQDVTSSGGCVTLGVSLAPREYAVLRLDRRRSSAGGNLPALYVSDSRKVAWTATDVITFSATPLQPCEQKPKNWTSAGDRKGMAGDRTGDRKGMLAAAVRSDARGTGGGGGQLTSYDTRRRRYIVLLTSVILARF